MGCHVYGHVHYYLLSLVNERLLHSSQDGIEQKFFTFDSVFLLASIWIGVQWFRYPFLPSESFQANVADLNVIGDGKKTS